MSVPYMNLYTQSVSVRIQCVQKKSETPKILKYQPRTCAESDKILHTPYDMYLGHTQSDY